LNLASGTMVWVAAASDKGHTHAAAAAAGRARMHASSWRMSVTPITA
jgi:hypothetical protein